jgi:hypothetical protein
LDGVVVFPEPAFVRYYIPMTSYVRNFSTSMSAENLPAARELLADKVIPALRQQPGCKGIEVLINLEPDPESGVTDAVLSTSWDSIEHLRAGVEAEGVAGGLLHLLPLVRVQDVLIKTYSSEDMM